MTAYNFGSRYTVPTFTERTSSGTIETNPYSKLFGERVIFVGAPVDDTLANDVAAQLIHLEGDNPDRDIVMYLNSSGGALTSMLSVYDTMQYVRSDIQTVCLGQAVGAAAVLLAAGTAGKRFMLPNATVVLSQPSIGEIEGQISDLEIQSSELQRLRGQMEQILARHTGHSPEKIHADLDRDKTLITQAAIDYGIVDHTMSYRKKDTRYRA